MLGQQSGSSVFIISWAKSKDCPLLASATTESSYPAKPSSPPPPQSSASSTLMPFTSLSYYLPTVCPLDNKDVIEKVSVPSHVILGATGDCRGRGKPSSPCCDSQIWKRGVHARVFRCACVCMCVQACAMCCVWWLEDFGSHALDPQPLSTGLSLTWKSLIFINSFYIGVISYGYIILE